MQLSVLFRKTEEHHENELKLLFQKYHPLLFQKYHPPVTSDEVNKKWTSSMSESELNKLRLHLSWAMGINTFEWDRHNIGEQTIVPLTRLGFIHSE